MKMDKKAKIKMVKEHIEEFVTLKELEEKTFIPKKIKY